MRHLAAVGLTTREACGNSVRTITACPYAGVSAEELFDVTPYAEALTRHFLRHPLSASLPRKFKIGFEGLRHRSRADRDQRHRMARPDRRRRHPRLPRHGGRRHRDVRRHGPCAPRLPARGGPALRRGSRRSRVPPAGRLPAQASQPAEVPHQVDRMGRVPRRVRHRAAEPCSRREACGFRSIRSTAPVESAPTWDRPAPPSRGEVADRGIVVASRRVPASIRRCGRS